MSELKKLEDQLQQLQIAKIRNTVVDKTYFEQMQEEVELLKQIEQLRATEEVNTEPEVKLWSEKEIQELHELYPYHTTKEIAAMIGRSFYAVESKVKLLGLKKNQQ